MAWYQRTYFIIFKSLKNLVKILIPKSFLFLLIMSLFLILFVFNKPVTYCFNSYLKPHTVGGRIVHVCDGITQSVVFDIIKYIKYNQFDKLNYNIYTPTSLCMDISPSYHPYRHPHLNIIEYNNLVNDVFVNVQMSSNNYNNCHLLSNENIKGIYRDQYIANNFYFYNNNVIEKYLYNCNDINNKLYLDRNDGKIARHIINLKNKYKI